MFLSVPVLADLIAIVSDGNTWPALEHVCGVTFSVDVMVLSFPPAQMTALPRILARKP